MNIECIGEARYHLGEGPLWDPVDGVLYFVDSLAPAVFRHDPTSGAIARRDLPGETVGSLALRDAGGMVLAMADGFHAYDFETGALEAIAEPEAGVANTRFNDGKVDRRGRFVAGSLERDFAARSGALYRLDTDLSVSQIEDRVVCANGPCWSPDGATFYFTDGGRAEIYAYDYDGAAGTVANRRVFAAAEPIGGHPDGATVDAQGFVWSALFGGAKVARFAPDGRLDRTVDLPAKLVTSVMFGGADLDVLYVTSARGDGGDARDDTPEAGALFRIDGLGVAGLPEPRFAG